MKNNSVANVAVIKCTKYEKQEIFEAVKRCIDSLGGPSSFIKNGDKVLLKPNMFRPSKSGTTHPEVVRAVAEIFQNAGAKIYLTDSPMTHSLEEVARFNGIEEVCKDLGIELIPIKLVKEVMVKNPIKSKSFFLPRIIDDMSLIINMPKLKAHPLTVFSGSIKNLFGLQTGLTKSQYHLKLKRKSDFCQMLLDLYSTVNPQLTIMDAVVGVDSKGNTKEIGAILASTDAIALDATACRMAGIPPDLVPTISYGAERKLGLTEKEKIKILGDIPTYPTVDDFEYEINQNELISSITISIFDSFFLKNSFAKPYITDKCTQCEMCIKICPKNAITPKKHISHINHKKCIRCYCCQEICPNNAIFIKKINPLYLSLTSYLQQIVKILRSVESKKYKQQN